MKPMFFVVGCPRSGTYLLSNILDQSGAVAVPTETHFIPLFARYAILFGDLRRPRARERLLDAVYAFLEIWLTRAEEERGFEEMLPYSLLATRKDFDLIVRGCSSYPEMVHAMFERFAVRSGAPSYGDKSAFFEHVPLELIDRAVGGEARFVHIVRDGRDVVLSWLQLKVGPENIATGARAWRDHVASKRRWGALHPDRYCELRYEDLLAAPEREVRRICEFAGVGFRPEMLDFHSGEMARAIANSTTHALLGKPIDPGNREKWRSRMSADDIALFESIAGSALADAGYPVVSGGVPGRAASRLAARRALQSVRGVLSYRNARLALKGALPAMLLLFRMAGVRIERVVNSKWWRAMEERPISRSR